MWSSDQLFSAYFKSKIKWLFSILFREKTGFNIILENSFQLKHEINNITTKYKFTNHEIILHTNDVKKMYKSLQMNDIITSVIWLMDFLQIDGIFQDGVVEIINLVFTNTFIIFKNRIVRLNDIVATGWVTSPNFANICLLYIEYNTRNSWINKLFSPHFSNLPLLALNLPLEKRYIDEIM
eukprot:UN08073